jgi:hypothetical protein
VLQWELFRRRKRLRRHTGRFLRPTRNLNFESLESRALLSAVAGTQVLNNFTITGNVGEKPESKIWKYAGNWWGVFSDSIGAHVWRLDGQTWNKTLTLSTLQGVQVDAKADGDITHVLFEDNLNSQLYSLQYVPGSLPTYKLWDHRPTPVSVHLAPSVEAATIDIDSNGRMWVAYDNDVSNIEVRYSDVPYSTWSDPIVVASNVHKDDIAALTALPNNTIGILWSNQNTKRFGFRTHLDGADPALWTADELPGAQSALKIGRGFADDHINLAVASDGTLFAAVKTSYDTSGAPILGILVRRPNGVWDNFYALDVTNGTRPIVQLNEIANTLIYSYDDNTNWVYRECNATTIICDPAKVLLSGGKNATSTKQNVTTDLVILTSSKSTSGKVHGALLKFNAPNRPPMVDAGPDESIFESQAVNLTGIVSDEGLPGPPKMLTTTWRTLSGPGVVSFSNSAALTTSAKFSEKGVYVLELVADDGELTSSDTITVTVETIPHNSPPIVYAGDDITIGVMQTRLTDGTVFDDGIPFVPGSVTTLWSLVSGQGPVVFGDPTVVDTTISFSEIGVYTLRLSASDGQLVSSDDIVVTVDLLPPNQAPVVQAGEDQTSIVGSPVFLSGSFQDDQQSVASGAMINWTTISGPGVVSFANDSSLQTSATFSQPGVYVLQLSVDDTALIGTDTLIVIISNTPETKSFQDGVFPTAAYTGTRDTKLRADGQKNNHGKDKRLEVVGRPDYASLLRWDVSEIPPGATVLGASLTVNVENTSTSSFKLYELLRNWVETETTFLRSTKSITWTTPGAAGIGTDRGAIPLGAITAPKKGLVTIELNEAGIAVVQKWIADPSTNHGLIVQDFTDALKDDLDFTSREGSKSITRPKLTIRYASPLSPQTSPLRTATLRNFDNPLDVNADTRISPSDALIVINSLNRGFAEAEQNSSLSTFFPDVSGDGRITPLDALLVINHLNEVHPELAEADEVTSDLRDAAALDPQGIAAGMMDELLFARAEPNLQFSPASEINSSSSDSAPLNVEVDVMDDSSRHGAGKCSLDYIYAVELEPDLECFLDELLRDLAENAETSSSGM